MYDVIVIGGGAAGMSAAISAGRSGGRVLVLEKNKKMGKKLYATGNGRCNLANEDVVLTKHYASWDTDYLSFLETIIGENPTHKLLDFVHSLGISTYSKKGYIYPMANQASAVVWAMLDELSRIGVEMITDAAVSEIHSEKECVYVKTDKDSYKAKTVILACGGRSYSSLGGSDMGYKLATSLNLKLTNIHQALCPVITTKDLSIAAGVRTSAHATLYVDGMYADEEWGELQITDYGLTGIMIFNLSSCAGKALGSKKKVCLSIDMVPQLENQDIREIFMAAMGRTCLGFLNGIINDKLARLILNECNIDASKKTDTLTADEVERLLDVLKNYRLEVSGLKDYEQAQVCSGGVSLSEIDADTMQLKQYNNIYIAGEIIDIDGKCGGYNLTFAILSGIKAGTGAYAYS
ncbi:MAG: aminoacetone oxidase family FAD-binding enzyme [Lachnospiraceae bacterium]|nr:aminoacetone oxidase family FAD-binding enzyme [Lachnospiraceae bacterium]